MKIRDEDQVERNQGMKKIRETRKRKWKKSVSSRRISSFTTQQKKKSKEGRHTLWEDVDHCCF
jgi:hypothetical protein